MIKKIKGNKLAGYPGIIWTGNQVTEQRAAIKRLKVKKSKTVSLMGF